MGDVTLLPSGLIPFGTEGSGNQIKLWNGSKLIKLNSKYRESSKEVSAYLLGTAFGLQMTPYRQCKYQYRGRIHIGCECISYLNKDEEAVSVFDMEQGLNVPQGMPLKKLFRLLVSAIAQYTHLSEIDISMYLMRMLVLDFLICNDDRHLNNIEFIYNRANGTFRPAPLFDHGESFMRRDSFTGTQADFLSLLSTFNSRPFSDNPRLNLIDIDSAKLIAGQFAKRVGGSKGISALPINNFHKRVVKAQFLALLGGDFH